MVIIQVLRRKTARASEDMHINDLRSTISENKTELTDKEGEIRRLTAMVASRDANIEALGEKLEDQKKELEAITL